MKEYVRIMVCLFVFGSTFFAWRPGFAADENLMKFLKLKLLTKP